MITKVDAYGLGYAEAANDDPRALASNTLTFTSVVGYGNGALIQMAQVDLGAMSFRNVEFVAFDIPQVAGFDVVLGRSILQFMDLELNYGTAQLTIEEAKRSV